MQLQEKFKDVRERTRSLCDPLSVEDHIPQPVIFASPPKWHLAHTTWFFEEFILKEFRQDYREFNGQFNYLFNSYYNQAGDRIQREVRGSMTRPSLDEVHNYRTYVDSAMTDLIMEEPSDQIKTLIELGLNHEQQHQELLITDLKHTFSYNPTWPVYLPEAELVNSGSVSTDTISVDEGLYEIGFDGNGFCYDNELGRHTVFLHAFDIRKGLVSNAEFIKFMKDGGYENPLFWLDDGWAWVSEHEITRPLYWLKKEGKWYNYTLAGLQPVRPDAAVCHINFYEASAFAEWAGMRLATEFEWEVAANKLDRGDRWEWTNSAYLPYPHFTTAEGAVGEYNGKFMVNQMVLRGQSVVTAPGHSRKTYRNFFHPHLRWQFSGIRLSKKR